MYEKVVQSAEQAHDDGYSVYKISEDAGVNFGALAFFGASIIWRAAIYNWGRYLEQIDLGPYESKFRLYLRGDGDFPDDATIIVDISRPENRLKSAFGGLATIRGNMHFRHTFVIPGIIFELAVGKLVPSNIRHLCCLRNHIIVSSNHEEYFRIGCRSLKNRGPVHLAKKFVTLPTGGN